MATTTTNPDREVTTPSAGAGVASTGVPAWPREHIASGVSEHAAPNHAPNSANIAAHNSTHILNPSSKPSPRDALQALLAFSALHDQVRRRKALAAQHH